MRSISLKEIRNKRRRNRSKRNNLFHFERPRLVVYRTSKHINVQIIDDHKSSTLVSASSNEKSLQKDLSKAKSKIEVSSLVGKVLAKRAVEKKIIKVVCSYLNKFRFFYTFNVSKFCCCKVNK